MKNAVVLIEDEIEFHLDCCATIGQVDINLLYDYVQTIKETEKKSLKDFSSEEIRKYRYLEQACDCLKQAGYLI